MIEELKEMGLTENEAKVYLTLLDLGPSLAGKISRHTGLHRRTIYDTTEMLIKKGLIGYILENNRRIFRAENPNRFLEIIKEKENFISPIIPTLMQKFQEKKTYQETNFYKGKAGLKTIFEDQLNYKEVLIIGASASPYETLMFYFDWYVKRRQKKKIKIKAIAYEKIKDPVQNANIKYLPKEYASPLSMNIYGDKVALILWSKEKPLAIVIKNQEFVDSYKQYFELMWNIAKY